MLSKFILVISLLFCVANAAVKFTVRDGNLRKVSKAVKAKAISKMKAHLQTNKVHPEVARIGKKVSEAKKLQAWNSYDSNFNSEFWTNSFFYTEDVSNNCAGSPVKQFSEFNSYCFVGTFTGSNSQVYESARGLFTSDCSQETVVFYSSNDCSGTPAAQGNTESNTYDLCVAYTNDYFTSVKSAIGTCTPSATAWTGGDAVEIITYEQTEQCSGDPDIYSYFLGGCYATVDGQSIKYSSGPTLSFYSTTDCSGTANQVVTVTSSCLNDGNDDGADDDDDDDGLVDDAQFTNVNADTSTSSKYEWTGASSTLVLNYYLSAALVVVFCTLSL